MSQRKRSATIVTAFILLILLTFHAAYTRLRAQIAVIEAEVSDIRGLERLQETTLNFRTRAEIQAESDASAEEEVSDETERLMAFYRALDLVSPDLDLVETWREYFDANVAGYFEFEAEEITILRAPGTQYGPLSFFERLTYGHEFMHVLQDQHYDLKQLWEHVGESENFDLALATGALVEGDAEAVEWLLFARQATRISERQFEYIVRKAEQASTVSGASKQAPAVIEAAFNFPYEQGKAFVDSLIESGSWERVHQAFTSDPPQSTEQIYHPERYLAGEAPIDLSLPDARAIIGDGRRQVYDSAVGEFYLRQHLMTNLSRSRAARAATGWGGDRLRIYKDSATGELIWLWHLAWDSAGEAVEFAEEYRRFLDRRSARAEADGRCWSRETTHCFRQIGESETRISMAADRETALALLQLDV